MINQIEDFLNQKKSSNITIESMFIDRLFHPGDDECFVLFEYKTKLSEVDFDNYFESITRIKCTFLVEKVFNSSVLDNLGFTNLAKLSKRNKINQIIEIAVQLVKTFGSHQLFYACGIFLSQINRTIQCCQYIFGAI